MEIVNKIALLVLVGCFTCSLGTGWEGKQADIYFVLDTSNSIWRLDFNKVKDLVSELVTEMDIGPNRTRVGVGIFSDYFSNIIPLNNTYTKWGLVDAIPNVPKQRGDAYVFRGLEGMRKHLDSDVTRSNVPRIAVFVTASSVRNSYKFYDHALAAKNDGIFVFTIGVGSNVRKEHLTYMSSHPLRSFLYMVSDFNHLDDIRPALSINMAEVSLYLNDKGTCGENSNVDTVFIYDERELGSALTDSVNRFLGGVLKELRVNAGNMRVGVVSASPNTCSQASDIKLGDFRNREDLLHELEDRRGDGRGIEHSLKKVTMEFFKAEAGHRVDNAMKRIVLIMSSPVTPENQRRIMSQAYRARLMYGITVYIVRHDSFDYDKTFLEDRRLVKSPDNVIYVDLNNAVEPFLQMFCRDI